MLGGASETRNPKSNWPAALLSGLQGELRHGHGHGAELQQGRARQGYPAPEVRIGEQRSLGLLACNA